MDTKPVILVVGAAHGIGAAVARKLRASGHEVLATSRNPDGNETTLSFDATDSSPSLVLPDKLDGIVYCPGTVNLKPFHRLTSAEIQNDLEVNTLGAVRLLQLALPALKKSDRASVVLFSTIAVGTGLPMHASIAMAKGAIEGLARSLAAEWAPKIRVNVIAPSLTDTPLVAPLVSTPEKKEASSARHPLKRIGDADETAAWVEHLLGPASGFMTGQVIRLDGGMSSVRTL
ncbi:MAG: SDR family NAD(P)-dependent oxidoreductase [Verrucomicrobiales bacterium]